MTADKLEWFLRKIVFIKKIVGIGIDKVPLEGPVLLLSNHRNWIDPIAIGIANIRRVRFMASGLLFTNPECQNDIYTYFLSKLIGKNFVSRWLSYLFSLPVMAVINGWGCVPSPQTKDATKAFEAIFQALEQGKIINLFPEGGFSKKVDGKYQLKPLKYGGAKIAYHFFQLGIDIPIYPVGIVGGEKFLLFPSKVTANIGNPLFIKDYCKSNDKIKTYQAFIDTVEQKILELIEQIELKDKHD